MVVLLFFIFGVGPFFWLGAIPGTKANIELIDDSFSARPLARILEQVAQPGEPVAVYRVRRDMEYGLSFYRDRRVLNYTTGGVPAAAHILVVRNSAQDGLQQLLAGRDYQPLFAYPAQQLSVYQVDAGPPVPPTTAPPKQ
jgi:hypothetical protein